MYDAIYLSPHLDDVVLSCGGQIYQRTEAGESVLIVTITAGDPSSAEPLSAFAHGQHQSWELSENPVAQRRAEDITAIEMLGADHLHLNTLDCIYRLYDGQPMYQSDEDIFGEVHYSEQELIDQLATQFAQFPAVPQIIVPLGLGNHVDHQITRLAAEQAFGSTLFYYEDYPYSSRQPWQIDQSDWNDMIIPLTVSALIQRTMAILAYESQVEHLFGSTCAMEKDLVKYIRSIGGERLWRKRRLETAEEDVIDL